MTDNPFETDVSQDQLDGFVPASKIRSALSIASDESLVVGPAERYFLIAVDDLADLRIDQGRRFKNKAFITLENARSILPPTYGPRDVDGATYPALHRVPRREVRGYLASKVEAIRARLASLREEREERRQRVVAERKSKFDAWLSGDESFDFQVVYANKPA